MNPGRLDAAEWAELEIALRNAVAAHAPGWVDHNVHDPGVTLLELLSYVIDELAARDIVVPERAAAPAARILDALSRLESLDPFEVAVDGERWTFVPELGDADRDARVYSVGPDGRILFGDGVHGRRPDAGSRIAVRYRDGAAGKGNVSLTVRTTWPLPDRALPLMRAGAELAGRDRGTG